MISLTCTHCKTVLNIDDAFAGGACRCQHCGTIQTVPSRLKQSAVAAPAAKTLYQHRNRAEVGTGLDELADVVASSGLSGSGLAAGQRSPRQKTAVAKANRSQTVLAIAGAVIVLLLIAIVYLAMQSPTVIEPAATEHPSSPAAVIEPNFLGIKLDGETIVYVIDRGSGTQKVFGDLKEATLRSLNSLGPDRKFQIVFWNNGTDEAFPSGSATYATRPNLEAARRTLDNISAFGATDVASAMTKAMQAKPNLIVLATGKAWDLDESFAQTVLDLRKDSGVRIHAIAVGGSEGSDAFATIAKETGGEFMEINEGQLREKVR